MLRVSRASVLLLTSVVIAAWAVSCVGKPTWPVTTPTPLPTIAISISAAKLPVLAGTSVPQPQVPLSPDNVAQMAELAIWGKGQAFRVAYSPDGKRLAVGTSIGIWLYDTSTLKEFRFINTGSKVYNLAFSLDSATIYAQTGEALITWWNVTTGERLGSFQANKLLTAFFLKDAKLVAVADGKQIGLWNMENGKNLFTLDGHTDDMYGLAFSPDGALLASGSSDQTIRLWNVKTGSLVRILQDHGTTPTKLAFSPDGTLLASSALDRTARSWKVELWEVRTGNLVRTWPGNSWEVFYLSFSPDGTLLASGVQDNTLHLWNVQTGAPMRTLEGLPRLMRDLAFSPDWAAVATAGEMGKEVLLWSPRTGARLGALDGYYDGVSGLVILPDGTIIVSHYDDGEIQLWDARAGRVKRVLEAHNYTVSRLALSADGIILASASVQSGFSSVVIWDAHTGQRWPARYDNVWDLTHMALSPNGKVMALSTESSVFSLYDVQTGQELRRLLGGHSSGLAFSSDGTKLASVSDKVKLWNVETGELLLTLEPPSLYTTNVTFAPDSATVAVGEYDGAIHLWNAKTGESLRVLEGHSAVRALAFSPNGVLLASGTEDGTMRLWDTETGRLLHTVNTPEVNVMAFSRDGRILALGCLDGTVRLWGVR